MLVSIKKKEDKKMKKNTKNAVGVAGIAMCCAMILGLSATAGTSIYENAATGNMAAISQDELHEQRVLARTIEGDESSDEWGWEVSTESYLSE